MDEDEEWMGAVVRSALDNRCWFAVIPGTDIMTSEGHCSISIRRVKTYVMDEVCRIQNVKPEGLMWVRDSDESWTLTEKPYQCGEPNPSSAHERCRRDYGHRAKFHAGMFSTWPVEARSDG